MSLYTDEERRIFWYFDGTEKVAGDPLEIDLRFKEALGGDPLPVYADYNLKADQGADGETQRVVALANERATLRLIAAVRAAFDMPFDKATGKGATGTDCCKALEAFWEWSEKNARSAASSGNGSRPSASTQGAHPSPTSNTSR